ncbi:MAG: ECF-type sigma factor, partial [Pirellulaceae bacterium]
ATPLWERFFHRLARVARAQLDPIRLGAGDEMDVALSAFHSFCRRAGAGQYPDLESREDLWRLLVVIAKRKAIDWKRHELAKKRGGGAIKGSLLLADIVSPEPTPEFTAELLDEMRHCFDMLRREDGTLRLIALRLLEGHSNEEIAVELSVSVRTVQRKFQRICILWEADVDQRAQDG